MGVVGVVTEFVRAKNFKGGLDVGVEGRLVSEELVKKLKLERLFFFSGARAGPK